MKRKRILTVLIVLALVFIWGNSLVSRELSGEISAGALLGLGIVSLILYLISRKEKSA